MFTTDPENFPLWQMQKSVEGLHESERRALFIADPGISVSEAYAIYKDGIKQDVFIKALDGWPYLGERLAQPRGPPSWFTLQYCHVPIPWFRCCAAGPHPLP